MWTPWEPTGQLEFGDETLPLLDVFEHGFLLMSPEEGGGGLGPVLLFHPLL